MVEKPDVKIDIRDAPAAGSSTESDAAVALQPVSFLSLFRFSTRSEIFLDLIGIFCAVISGAAQVRHNHDQL